MESSNQLYLFFEGTAILQQSPSFFIGPHGRDNHLDYQYVLGMSLLPLCTAPFTLNPAAALCSF